MRYPDTIMVRKSQEEPFRKHKSSQDELNSANTYINSLKKEGHHNNCVFWPQVNKQIRTYILDGEVLSGIFCRPINYNEIIFLYKFLTNAT